MAMAQNKETAPIRDKIGRWINNQKGKGFTLSTVRAELSSFLKDFGSINTDKAVSNELLRMVGKGLLTYTVITGKGCDGRPPHLYKQVWVTE